MTRMRMAFAITGLFMQFVFAQCPEYDLQVPHLSNVVVKSIVALNTPSSFFSYTYSLTNGPTSTGCIEGIDIDISVPLNSVQLSSVGLIDYPRYVDRTALSFDTTVHVIPIGIPKLPSYKGLSSAWFALLGVDSSVGWFRAIPEYRLEPGARIDGITMTSYGLPGIRRFVVSPSYNPKPTIEITPQNEDSVRQNTPERSGDEENAFQLLEDTIKVRGITLGPTAPPLNFVPVIWIDTLISYKHQAVSLGWLKDRREDQKDEDDEEKEDGIVAKLDKRLDKVRAELVKGDSLKARKELEKLVKKVEKIYKKSEELERKKHESEIVMTSEAYALLKYNAEYLIDRLPSGGKPKQKGGKDNDDKDHH